MDRPEGGATRAGAAPRSRASRSLPRSRRRDDGDVLAAGLVFVAADGVAAEQEALDVDDERAEGIARRAGQRELAQQLAARARLRGRGLAAERADRLQQEDVDGVPVASGARETRGLVLEFRD